MSNFFSQLAENAVFALEFAGVVLAMFVIAYVVEKISKKKNGDNERILSTRNVAVIGVFAAISTILMFFEFGVFFLPPSMYKFDFSELPALIGGFAFGPVVGVMIEFIKVLLKTLIKGTHTAFVGELANFAVGCSFILPATIIYKLKKNRKNAIIACVVGTAIITIFGSTFNAVYLIPTFADMFGMPVDAIVGMGHEVNKNINDLTTFILWGVAPLNLIKGGIDSIITLAVYKKLSPIIKHSNK